MEGGETRSLFSRMGDTVGGLIAGAASSAAPPSTAIGFTGAMDTSAVDINTPRRNNGNTGGNAQGHAPPPARPSTRQSRATAGGVDFSLLKLSKESQLDSQEPKVIVWEYDGNPSSICGAKVRAGLLMCTASPIACTFQNMNPPKHQKPIHHKFQAGDIFMKDLDNRLGAVYTEPMVPAAVALDNPLIQQVVGMTVTKSTASRLFGAAIAGQLKDESGGIDPDAKAYVEERVEAAAPGKSARAAPTPFKKARPADGAGDGVATSDFVNTLNDRMLDLEGQVGLSGAGSASNLWSGQAFVESELKRQGDLMAKLVESLNTLSKTVRVDVTAMQRLTNQATAYGLAGQRAGQEAKEQIRSIQATGLDIRLPQQVKAQIDGVEAKVGDLNVVTAQAVGLLSGVLDGTVPIPGATGGTGGGPTSTPQNIEDELEALKVEFSQIKQIIDGGSITTMGNDFSCLEDCFTFGRQYFPPKVWQCIPSMMTLFQQCSSLIVTNAESEQSAVHEARVQRTAAQSAVIASLKTTFPPLFGGTKDGGTQEHTFSAMKTFKQWSKEDGVHGLRYTAWESFKQARLQQATLINTLLKGHPIAKAVCHDLLSRVVSYTDWLFQRITSFYTQMVNTTGAASAARKEACWNVVTTTLRDFFMKLKEKRIVAGAAHHAEEGLQTGYYLYAALMELKVEEDIQAMDWERHPLIQPSIMKYVFNDYMPRSEAAAAGPDPAVGRRVEAVETSLARVQHSIDTCSGNVSTLKTDSGTLKRELSTLGDKIKSVENKVKRFRPGGGGRGGDGDN